MLIEITARGVYGKDEIPIGTHVEVKREPKEWTGKYRIVNSPSGKTLEVASPAPEPEPEQDDKPKRRGRHRKSEPEE